MSYNLATYVKPRPPAMSNGTTTPTPEQNAEAIAQLTATVNLLVTKFITPAIKQTRANFDRLERIDDLFDRHAEAIVGIDERLERVTIQIEASAQQIKANTEAITGFNTRLEETRALVAENASGIAQLKVLQTENAQQIASNAIQIASNASQIEAIAEASRTQLAGIIGNGRRIDRLEQQAS